MTFEDEMPAAVSYADGQLVSGRIDDIGVLMPNQPYKRIAVNLAMWEGCAPRSTSSCGRRYSCAD